MNTEKLLREIEDNSGAGNPGRLPMSYPKLRIMRPDLFGFEGYVKRVKARYEDYVPERDRIERHLRGGDSRAAVVISTSPLLVAAFSDDLDCVAMLKLDEKFRLAETLGLQAGSRLLTINTYSDYEEPDGDLVRGPNAGDHWTGFEPVIGDFITSDPARAETRKREISEEEWSYTQHLGEEYHRRLPGVARDGCTAKSYLPAEIPSELLAHLSSH